MHKVQKKKKRKKIDCWLYMHIELIFQTKKLIILFNLFLSFFFLFFFYKTQTGQVYVDMKDT